LVNQTRNSLLRSLLVAAGSLAAPLLFAQSAHWDPPGGTLPVGEVSQLQLIFDDCSPDDTPAPPKVDGLTLENQGQSSNISLINGTFSRTVAVGFSVLLAKQQEVEIPSFTVATNKGQVKVPAAHFAPAGATVGSAGVSLSTAVSSSMEAEPSSIWAGEVFDLKYSISAGETYYPNWGRGVFEWDATPLVAEDWSPPSPLGSTAGGPAKGLSYHTRAIAPAAGRVTLNAPTQLVNLSVGVSGFGFFQQRQYQQFSVSGTPPVIDVRPLPPAPAGFTGAVGEFRVASKVVPTRVGVGEPITWTIELSGTGNWPQIHGLPSREVSADFQTVEPKPKRTQPQGRLFDGSLAEDVVLLPTKAGTYDLPPLEFTYFEPKSGTYKVITAPGASVVVEEAAAPAAAAGAQPAAPGSAVPAITVPSLQTEAKAPELPSGALGDPVAFSGSAPEPLRQPEVLTALLAPFALVGGYWAFLAYRRARSTDPLRPKRAARARLDATLRALSAAPASGKAPLLIAWQRDSAVLWGIEHAAPPASEIADPAWSTLWSEADRTLYGRDCVLSSDWIARANTALAAKRLRPFSPFRLFLLGNLFPLVAILLAAAAGPRVLAADPVDAYAKGDYAGAADAWSAQLANDPRDGSARHNLSLALSQQDRWAEAAVQASAAFIQNPSDPASRRQLALACDKADFVPQPLDALTQAGPMESLARMQSPGGWQRTAVAASILAAAALALALAVAYGGPRRAWALPVAISVLVISMGMGTASLLGYRSYGIMADTRAVVVWRSGTLRSIPTEADVSQKTTALAAGSTAIADKPFLGWIRLSFPNGESGWVAASEIIYLWQPPPK
jgi:hypothetical protein